MADSKIYGTEWIAEYLDCSESTVRRLRRRPEGAFIRVGSMDNAVAGGYGQAAWSYASSLDNIKPVMKAFKRNSCVRNAQKRCYHTDVTSGTNF